MPGRNHCDSCRLRGIAFLPPLSGWGRSDSRVTSTLMDERQQLQEPVRKRFGGSLSKRAPLERLAMLQRNAEALLGNSWRGKDDGTLIRKVFGKPAR